MSASTDAIAGHYAAPELLSRIEAGLDQLGLTPATLDIDALGPVDEFHLRAAAATEELIALLDPTPDMRVLDAGSGLGGPARRLARARGCRVSGVDLCEDYCRVGTVLNTWLGLEGRVDLSPGDVTRLDGLADESFDAAWSLHVGMNVPDKAAFYAQILRVLRPGAKFVIYDVLAADARPQIAFPVPWAREPANSFLLTLDALGAELEAAGFELQAVREHTPQALDFVEEGLARAARAPGPPPLGLHLVLGADLARMLRNMRRNLSESRLRVMALACTRPG